MDCALCASYLAMNHDVRAKGVRMPYCAGCRPRGKDCGFLKKRCATLREGRVRYCYECAGFPCERLLRIEDRYVANYRTSLVGNSGFLRAKGMKAFLARQRRMWRCPRCGGTVCCHNGLCFSCDVEELKAMKKKYRWKAEERKRKSKGTNAKRG
jgi:hypothetical protein